MFAFILNKIYAQYALSGMKWNWTPEENFTVYFYCRALFEFCFRGVYEELFEHFFVVILHMNFEINPP